MAPFQYEPSTLPTNHNQGHNHLISLPQRTVKSKKEKRTSTFYKYIPRRSHCGKAKVKSEKDFF